MLELTRAFRNDILQKLHVVVGALSLLPTRAMRENQATELRRTERAEGPITFNLRISPIELT